MFGSPTTRTLALAALILGIGASPARAQEAEPAAVRQTEFLLPFRLAAPADGALGPVEVQLHASANHGGTWQVAGKVKPSESRFVFRAPHDGEYWFCIRTVDRQGNIRPDAPPKAELRVIVDTAAPRLELKAARGPAGEITAHWQAVDPNLKPESLTLEYQGGASQSWERVAIEPGSSHTGQALTGDATWWPKSSTGVVTVRAQISDRAGNPAVSQAQVGVDGPRDAAPRADAPPVAAIPLAPQTTPQAPFRLSSSSETISRSSAAADRAASDRAASGAETGGGGLAARLNMLPPGERPRMINARRFELDYDVDAVGPSGIAKVELWGTIDGGKTWKSFGVDNDNRSPIVANVPGEGLYGFSIVFQNGNGFGGLPPREGDAPEIWVGVDLTAPAAKITGAEIGRDNGELVIRWLAQDDMLDPRPISLYFSERPTGPWSAIAAGLENLGQYAWRLDNRVPDRIYLRIEVRDEAGNIGSYIDPDPVAIDLQRPQGHIRGVHPLAPR